MKHVTHIFFDLDHTLWDYDTNARAVLQDIYTRYEVSRLTTLDVDGFITHFFQANGALWKAFDRGEVDKEEIRERRFRQVLLACGAEDHSLADEMTRYFGFNCPRQPGVMEDAAMILEYLTKKYQLSIITNGFNDVQGVKLSACGLDKFFEHVFTSDTIGARKPSAEIFEHAMDTVGTTCGQALMIGDNPKTDILGAQNAGITPLLFNPTGKIKSECQYQIKHLGELMRLL
ncbi:YjjG family noncanonical pyrimidine nucleotidase [Marinoscillum furvescens]|uniref:Putative hydrolase of the HAD superfamily n=1 Tax=Marinoscillum furvescens DSM 4134 TaxID=1122208 RepID=A0A3D9KYL3_MARFU|nr:YjjG family noncanonical pyrimidine nucleotidase [Marinoscillum furvescens]RED93621.1 putative hydrolase of the HAD superfamily [Marinoscillum furvescens DSM 4134]